MLSTPTHPARADGWDSLGLQHAAEMGHVEVCRMLLEAPHHPARADACDGCALRRAAENGHVDVCMLLRACMINR